MLHRRVAARQGIADDHRVDVCRDAERVVAARDRDAVVGEQVAPYKRPSRIVLLDNLPHSSTGKILKTVESAAAGTRWAIGTELHLVNRLKQDHPEQDIHFLSPVVCMCATMYRIDLAHLCWSLENIVAGAMVNKIEVDSDTTEWSLIALRRMLEQAG